VGSVAARLPDDLNAPTPAARGARWRHDAGHLNPRPPRSAFAMPRTIFTGARRFSWHSVPGRLATGWKWPAATTSVDRARIEADARRGSSNRRYPELLAGEYGMQALVHGEAGVSAAYAPAATSRGSAAGGVANAAVARAENRSRCSMCRHRTRGHTDARRWSENRLELGHADNAGCPVLRARRRDGERLHGGKLAGPDRVRGLQGSARRAQYAPGVGIDDGDTSRSLRSIARAGIAKETCTPAATLSACHLDEVSHFAQCAPGPIKDRGMLGRIARDRRSSASEIANR
jgi:hypothetical protein